MLTLFSKNEPLFAHVRKIDTDQLPIVTGFDFYDRFLAAAAATDEVDFSTYMDMKELDKDILLQRYPFFAEILEADAETRAQTYILQRSLPNTSYSLRKEYKQFNHIAACMLVLRDLCSQTNMFPISEKLSLEIVEEIGQDLFYHVFVDMLIPSFPDGPPSALKKSLVALIDEFSDPVRPKVWSQIEQLERLETFIGREPKNNSLIAEAASIVETSHEKGDELLSRISPIFKEFYSENAKVTGRIERERLSEKMDACISAMSPEERGRFASDIALIRKATNQDPFWKKVEVWHDNLPSFQPKQIEKIYFKDNEHQKVLNRKMVLTSDQAYLLLEDALGLFGRDNRLQVKLSSPVIRTLIKYMEPKVRPDLVKAIGLNFYINKQSKEPLLLAMLGEQKDEEDCETKLRKKLESLSKKLRENLAQHPGAWFEIVPNCNNQFEPDTSLLANVNQQLYPHFRAISEYCRAIAIAHFEGYEFAEKAQEMRMLLVVAEDNLRRLEHGEGSFNQVLFEKLTRLHSSLNKKRREWQQQKSKNGDFHAETLDCESQANRIKVELHRLQKLLPKLNRWNDPLPVSIERKDVIEREKESLATLKKWISLLDWIESNRDFIKWQKAIAPAAAATRPSAKWMAMIQQDCNPDNVLDFLSDLEPIPSSVEGTDSPTLALLDYPLTENVPQFGQTQLHKGVIWAAHLCNPDKAGPLLVDYVKKCFVTLPGVGIKAEKLGNAALWALQNMPDGKRAPYLAHILARNKYPKVRKKVSEALDVAAAEAGITRATLEELTAPDHAMADGVRRIAISDGAAILTAEGSKVQLSWEDGKGVVRKAPPKAMKDMDPDGIKAAKGLAKEIEQDIATQSLRLDGLYLKQSSWPFEEWRSRYADHGTLGMLTRRLIWRAELPNGAVTVLPTASGCVDVTGQIIDCSGARMHLWHPIGATDAEIQAWRDRLMELEIQQPFKQVWREIYRLTDAEIKTETYSNRFAGHIVRQHQMMTLAQLNGWKCTHRMWVDAPNDEPSHIHLRDFDLYAEFWTEGAGGRDEPPVLDSQAYIYLTTDRLKFCGLDEGAPYGRGNEIALDQVPAIVFSEIMRHCDLFTSVPSICLDAEWMDRGANAEHPNQWHRKVANPYWRQSQIADLGTSARMRHDVLAAILPRLKKSDVFTLDGQFLHVQGIRHQYAIHLGSGAVQLKPSARHICIVRAGTLRKADMKIHLPFEGDTILSMVLSKALMLAQDDKITDPVILRQLP